MDLEEYFIAHFAKSSKAIGDDAAYKSGLLYSQDAFFEGVHFRREWMPLGEIAKRAMLVNISDAVAMQAIPRYALLSVAVPRDITKKELKELAFGFKEAASAYGVEIIGGDTIANSKLDISITIISASKKPLRRKGIKHGHLLAYTGRLGKSAKELKRLLRGGKIHARSKFRSIELRASFLSKARRYLSAGMDISDGLFSDLAKLSSINGVGYCFFWPVAKEVGCSGEEYEMLIAFDARYKNAIMRRAKQARTALTIFAQARRGRYKNRCKGHHFG